MSGLSQSQSQSSNSVSFSIPSSSLGLGYSGLLQGMGVGVSPSTGLPLGLSMSEGASSDTITTQDLDSGTALPTTSTANNSSMLHMVRSRSFSLWGISRVLGTKCLYSLDFFINKTPLTEVQGIDQLQVLSIGAFA